MTREDENQTMYIYTLPAAQHPEEGAQQTCFGERLTL